MPIFGELEYPEETTSSGTSKVTTQTPSLNDHKNPTGELWEKLEIFACKLEDEIGTVYGRDGVTDEVKAILNEAKEEAYTCQTLKDFEDHRTKWFGDNQ
jgi:sugar-specific transcriptional regulator TrmB